MASPIVAVLLAVAAVGPAAALTVVAVELSLPGHGRHRAPRGGGRRG